MSKPPISSKAVAGAAGGDKKASADGKEAEPGADKLSVNPTIEGVCAHLHAVAKFEVNGLTSRRCTFCRELYRCASKTCRTMCADCSVDACDWCISLHHVNDATPGHTCVECGIDRLACKTLACAMCEAIICALCADDHYGEDGELACTECNDAAEDESDADSDTDANKPVDIDETA